MTDKGDLYNILFLGARKYEVYSHHWEKRDVFKKIVIDPVLKNTGLEPQSDHTSKSANYSAQRQEPL
jgi:hypothetical protein